jgi:hypothetical protein
MENLPPEVIISILEKCDVEDLESIQLYCEAWGSVLDDNLLFLKMFQKENEEAIWQKVFPNYPRLTGRFSSNYFLLRTKVERYRYVTHCARLISNDSLFCEQIAEVIYRGENPDLNIADFERYIYSLSNSFPRINLVRFLECMIELHNWPFCFQGYKTNFPGQYGIYWKTICDAFTRGMYPGVLEFLGKYKEHIIWSTRELYKYLTEEFLLQHRDIWRYLDWSSIIVKVRLNEHILEDILEVRAQRESWYGNWTNIAYIAAHQQMSESFIERWFVNTCFDEPTNWSNILRCQHISSHFKDKYEYKARRRFN